ncbi:hypothetical protein [Sphingobacterium thalpophilum]|uniref:hypothetical protein n=1 Tax=Sphingobacterium thalpophilum TaxID=259 RepID=UPI0031D1AD24
MKIFKLINLFLISIICIGTVQAQDKRIIDESFFSSPTAANLGEFGQTEIKQATGGVYRKIPLFSVKSGDLSYNPELQYFSNGFKVDEWGGRLGMGWTENFAGLIQREVRSVPDEHATSRPQLDISMFSTPSAENLKLIKELVLSNENRSGKDAQRDIFYFTFFGISGSFVIIDGKCVQLSHQERYRIELLSTAPYSFVITDKSGVKYYFGLNGEVELTSFSKENACDYDTEALYDVPTAWFLSRVVSPKGGEISFSYQNSVYSYMYDFNQSYSYEKTYLWSEAYYQKWCGFFNSSICYREKTTKTKYLTAVTGNSWQLSLSYTDRRDLYNDKLLQAIVLRNRGNNGVIEHFSFGYDQTVSVSPFESLLHGSLDDAFDRESLKVRYFLQKITNIGKGGEYKLWYNSPRKLPHRFSFSQDLAGFYNGKGGGGLIPGEAVDRKFDEVRSLISTGDRSASWVSETGLLSKISFPAGGYDTIVYEQNTHMVQETVDERMTVDEQFINETGQEETKYSSTFTAGKYEEVGVTLNSDYDGGEYPYDNDGSFNWVRCELWDLTADQRVEFTLSDGTTAYAQQMLLYENRWLRVRLTAGHQYRLSVLLYGPKTTLSFSCRYTLSSGSRTVAKPFFGVRVREIVSYPNRGEAMKTTYSYNLFKESGGKIADEGVVSSTVVRNAGRFATTAYYEELIQASTHQSSVSAKVQPFEYLKIGSRNLNNMHVFGGQIIAYSHVTAIKGDESFTAYENLVSPDMLAVHVTGYEILPETASNNGTLNGMPARRYAGTRKNGIMEVKDAAFWTYSQWQYRPHISDFFVAALHADIENGGEPTEQQYLPYAVSYSPLFFDVYKLSSTKNVSYFGTQVVSKTDTVYYDNPVHAEPTRMVSDQGDGSVRYVFTLYPDDYPAGTDFIDNMKQGTGHLIASPVERVEVVARNGTYTVVKGELLNYRPGGKGILDQIRMISPSSDIKLSDFKFSNKVRGSFPPSGTSSPFLPDTRYVRFIAVSDHDAYGNPVEIKKQEGPPVVYLWGYRGQYPIAKIENVSYQEVKQALNDVSGTFLSQLGGKAEPAAADLTRIDNLRSHAVMQKAQITTFTYKPLVGMTSKTDPRGIKESYTYDGMQRLQAILDHLNQVNRAFDYHYRPN